MTSIRKLLCLALLIPVVCTAKDWVVLGHTDVEAAGVDKDSISYHNGMLSFNTFLTTKKTRLGSISGKSYKSSTISWIADCNSEVVVATQIQYYKDASATKIIYVDSLKYAPTVEFTSSSVIGKVISKYCQII